MPRSVPIRHTPKHEGSKIRRGAHHTTGAQFIRVTASVQRAMDWDIVIASSEWAERRIEIGWGIAISDRPASSERVDRLSGRGPRGPIFVLRASRLSD